MKKKLLIIAAYISLAVTGQVQANLCTKISTWARSAATRLTSFARSQAVRFADSRVSRFIVPRKTSVHPAGNLWKKELDTIFYKPLRWGEREACEHNKKYKILDGSYDQRTVYNYRPLLTVASTLGGFATLFATYQVGKAVGKKEGSTEQQPNAQLPQTAQAGNTGTNAVK